MQFVAFETWRANYIANYFRHCAMFCEPEIRSVRNRLPFYYGGRRFDFRLARELHDLFETQTNNNNNTTAGENDLTLSPQKSHVTCVRACASLVPRCHCVVPTVFPSAHISFRLSRACMVISSVALAHSSAQWAAAWHRMACSAGFVSRSVA